MTLSKLGSPACVVLTDGDDQAVSLLQSNLEDPFNQITLQTYKTRLLQWGLPEVAGFGDWCRKAYEGNDSVGWNTASTPDTPVRFDCIVAGDVMYKSELPVLFFETVDALLIPSSSNGATTGGVLWLCHVPRATVTHQVVQSAARNAGFHVETVDLSQFPPVQGCPLEDSSRAQVYRITRRRNI
jgi:hypothetical protein